MSNGRRARAAAALTWFGLGATAYVAFGYPLLVGAAARLRPRPVRRDPDALPSVSLLIPAHNEGDVLGPKLAGIDRIDYPPDRLEVIVVDDGSTDDTASVARSARARPCRVVDVRPRRGKSVAVNRGVAAATGDVIILSDASAELEPGAVRAIVAPFADPSIGAVSGTIHYRDPSGRSAPPANVYWRYEDALRRWESASGSTVGVNGNLFAFRRATYQPLPDGTVNDEFTIAMRVAAAGARVVYEPDAISVDIAAGARVEAERRTRITAARFQSLFGPGRSVWRRPGVAFRVVSHKLLRGALPAVGLATLAGSGMLVALGRGPAAPTVARRIARLDRPFAELLVAVPLCVIAAAGLGAAMERKGRRIPRPLALARYVVAVNTGALRGLVRAPVRRPDATWRTGREVRA
jgi:hypothetical protein